MRLDYTFYVLAVALFLAAALSFIMVTEQNGRNLYVASTAILGILCAIVGFLMKPKPQTSTPPQQTTTAPAQEAPQQPLTEPAPSTPLPQTSTVESPEKPAVAPADVASELTQIRGISKARAEQLKANGIETIKALSEASPEVLAEKLQVSPKIVKMWIGSAKKLTK
ncbi:MAG: helix-hairpin-helix domain-containing protein [Candidatus Bathyarchaeia archaeon]|jgi:predicted flap endonuclease-1-like 5' DNA nuclease